MRENRKRWREPGDVFFKESMVRIKVKNLPAIKSLLGGRKTTNQQNPLTNNQTDYTQINVRKRKERNGNNEDWKIY